MPLNQPQFTAQVLRVAAGLMIALPASASTTIFFEDFSGAAGQLGGQAPTIGTGTWSTPTYVEKSGSGSSNAIQGASTNSLAFTLEAGNIYTLSADFRAQSPSSTSSKYAGIGFFNETSPTFTAFPSLGPETPWMFLRTQNNAANQGDMSLRPLGTDISGYSAIDSSFDVTVTRNYSLVLDTTASEYTLSLFVDDVQYGSTFTYSEAESIGLLSSITGVGFTTSTSSAPGVIYDNFSLTSVPEPSTWALILGASTLAIAIIRKRRR
ncbi:PEP-CTERM sorting domain-containing protein [Cerasicoccus maritimus]|uniref:PEP-CTERM sorting domain-containing protein n=1 Tax=Cerasicoccus maritimus TaxID=490089 RepID=UPI002852757B|nr:PEP-CTERM sorting domain-containing protein [Cerasicoccus maritimus]